MMAGHESGAKFHAPHPTQRRKAACGRDLTPTVKITYNPQRITCETCRTAVIKAAA